MLTIIDCWVGKGEREQYATSVGSEILQSRMRGGVAQISARDCGAWKCGVSFQLEDTGRDLVRIKKWLRSTTVL